MNVLMICSSDEDINPYYTSIARSVSRYLAQNECDLVFDESSSPMMKICFEEFSKNKRNISSFVIRQDRFLNSDLVVSLPGGSDTILELLSYIKEKDLNNIETPIIVYDEDGFYNSFIEEINTSIKDNLVSEDILNMFKIVTNKYDFENEFFNMKWRKK